MQPQGAERLWKSNPVPSTCSETTAKAPSRNTFPQEQMNNSSSSLKPRLVSIPGNNVALLPVLPLFQTVEKQPGCIVEGGQMVISAPRQNLLAMFMVGGLFSPAQHPPSTGESPKRC